MTVPKAALTYAVTDKMVLGVVRAAWPVAAINVGAASATNNWIFGRGTPIAVDGGYRWIDSGAQTKFLRYYGRSDDNHGVWALALVLQTTETNKLLTVTVTLPDATIATVFANDVPTLFHFAWENTAGNADVGHTLTIEWDGNYCGLSVLNAYLYECPTLRLPSDTGTVGIVARQQIFDGYDAPHLSMGGLARAVEQQRADYFRRGALYNWSSGEPLVISATTYTALHPHGAVPAIQTRLMYSGETVRTCQCNVYAAAVSSPGSVRITMANGDVATFTIAASTVGWQSSSLDIDVTTDDPARWSVDGGIRGGTRDTVTIESKRGLGGTLSLYGVSIWDPNG